MGALLKKLEDIPVMGGLDDSPRGRVLRGAAHLFRVQGYDRTTVRDLAAVIGIQSGSIFHHFKTKEDILCAVMEEAINYNFGRMKAAVTEAGGTRDKLLALIRTELESINGETGEAMAVLVYEWNALGPDNQQKLLALREEYENLWFDVLRQAREEGLIEQDPILWRRLLGGAIAWTGNWYKPQGPLSMDQLAEVTLQMACKK